MGFHTCHQDEELHQKERSKCHTEFQIAVVGVVVVVGFQTFSRLEYCREDTMQVDDSAVLVIWMNTNRQKRFVLSRYLFLSPPEKINEMIQYLKFVHLRANAIVLSFLRTRPSNAMQSCRYALLCFENTFSNFGRRMESTTYHIVVGTY